MSIVLVGLPGSGKTKLGRIIAKDLGLDFVDLDEQIELDSGATIPELFESGESHFRDWEARILRESSDKMDAVISTGGGIVEREENRRLLEDSLVVFLDVDVEEAIRRASRSTHRPLLAGGVAEKMRTLADRRTPWYRQVASISVKVDDRPAQENARRVIEAINEVAPEEIVK